MPIRWLWERSITQWEIYRGKPGEVTQRCLVSRQRTVQVYFHCFSLFGSFFTTFYLHLSFLSQFLSLFNFFSAFQSYPCLILNWVRNTRWNGKLLVFFVHELYYHCYGNLARYWLSNGTLKYSRYNFITSLYHHSTVKTLLSEKAVALCSIHIFPSGLQYMIGSV